MRAVVLAYHSHNVFGREYGNNDHVAFASDLRTIAEAGARIVPLADVARFLDAGALDGQGELAVGLSFDDGPRFDVADFEHAEHGPQRSFLSILRDHHAETGRAVHATSFVIASPEARAAMQRECGYPDQGDWLGDDWWGQAASTGVLEIGNHSWDHVHHAVPTVAAAVASRDDFTQVRDYDGADAEIRAATDFIETRGRAPCRLFAYPFGHVNEYLAREYLPRFGREHRMVAAFGTGGRPLRPGDSVWDIPRAVCGHHWRSPHELRALLAG